VSNWIPIAALAVAAACSVCAPVARAASWVVDAKRSSIGFSGTHAGNTFNGSFGKWSSSILFDPAQLATAKVVTLVDLTSARTGDRTYDSTLPQADWFNTKSLAQARFETTKITSLGNSRYEAAGTLTLRGKQVPVVMPFTLAINGNQAVMRGATTLKRLDFDIGRQSDPTAAWVSPEIKVTIAVIATRK
jgi:polyisoprenoid-binding protein YceI